MSFFEGELSRYMQYHRTGGQKFNTAVVAVQSGQEQRNRAWQNPRAEYTGGLTTSVKEVGNLYQFVEQIRTFFLMVGGMADGFRYYDPIDCIASNEAMVVVSGSIYQLQKTYSLGGRTYVRAITKPITSSVIDFKGNALPNTISVTGGTISSVDHTTGQVTLSGVSGTPHASFQYHIPVRFTSDQFDPEIQESDLNPVTGIDPTDPTTWPTPIIKWNSLGLIEVRPPNY